MSSTTTHNGFETLFRDGFVSPPLTRWLDWVSGRDESHFVALPLLQRGAVWKPRQIITLWDSLFRGMPIGGLMLSRLHAHDRNGNPVQVRRVGSSQLQAVPVGGGTALIDGQQRTLAMLLGWPHAGTEQRLGRTLWVDLADKPDRESLFRMHVTSAAHPYGYSKSDPNAKLSLAERRSAREELQGQQYPWESHFPVRLTELIQLFLDADKDVERWKTAVLAQLQSAKPYRNKSWKDYEAATSKWNCLRALDQFALALHSLFNLKLPLIAVPEKCFAPGADQDADEPALAILFKRVGTGGTELSDADYVYSVIKHHLPQSFQLVESLAAGNGFAQLLGPIDIVMTAVRLVAAELGLDDFESPNKANFDSLRRNEAFLARFLALVESGRLAAALQALTEGLKYRPENGARDPGLPMHAFVLVTRPVLQVLLCWLLQSSKDDADPAGQFTALVTQSREEMLRFVLYAHLGQQDGRKASAWAFAWLKSQPVPTNNCYPGQQLVAHLIRRSIEENREVACALPTKEEMQSLAISTPTDTAKPLIGWERFQIQDEGMRKASGVFRRWWGTGRYQHLMLLWLQRAYIDCIDKNPDEVRTDDEVPYDYDHICPANHWRGWRGVTSKDRLIDFLAKENNGGHFHVGNSIGNVRVWYASHNRHDCDDPVAVKLKLGDNDAATASSLLEQSAICADHVEWWKTCSGIGSASSWSTSRAWAFQHAVERRVSALYAQYFDELDFSTWFPMIAAEVGDAPLA